MSYKELKRARLKCLALFFCTLLTLSVGGCSLDILSSSEETADQLANKHGWQKLTLPAQAFTLRGYLRPSRTKSDQLTIYIEEDGYAWINEYTVSADPTPIDSLVLKLAVRHSPGPVLYLARPCQFIQSANCHPRYWTIDRYAPVVIEAMEATINRIKQQMGARTLKLIGFSGGGTIAALLAARRDDIDEIVTLGANLDHAYWTAMDRLSPLTGSLNPADFTQQLQKIPQRHFIGADDVVVHPRVVQSYINKMNDRSKTKLFVLKGFDHDCCWVKNWPQMIDWH